MSAPGKEDAYAAHLRDFNVSDNSEHWHLFLAGWAACAAKWAEVHARDIEERDRLSNIVGHGAG